MTNRIINPGIFRMGLYQFGQERYLKVNIFSHHCVNQSCILIILVDLHRKFRPLLRMRVIKGPITINVSNVLVSLVKSRIQVNSLPVASFSLLIFFKFIEDVAKAEVQLFTERMLVEHVFVPILSTRYIFFESEAQSQSIIWISMYLALFSGLFIPPFYSTLEITNLIINIAKPIEWILQTRISFQKLLIVRNSAIEPIVLRTGLRAILGLEYNLRVIAVFLGSTEQLR